ncbi:helix-turn-helix domain-containing protein [Aeromonas caviae]|uniref:helix-turn-helix domain-containing protein n=1 Tax=Aeromonas caviae TaxID=648 RepID=UPI00214E715E|nr:helix-turn-helix domain-containing protein [Aeromonas caviae]MCR3895437.1 helix-turn-helix domain-containing protein [Aeromonas caviae]
MDSKTLLEAYMRAKKMTQFKEVAAELGFSSQYISQIKKGFIQVTDETAIRMAKEIGIDPIEVMISLNAVRTETPEVKAAWYDALKKYCASTGTAMAVGLTTMTTLSLTGTPTALIHFLC